MTATKKQGLDPKWCGFLRVTAYTGLAFIGLGLFLLVVHRLVLPIIAWALPKYQSLWYELAAYGIYRSRFYVTLDFRVPDGNMVRWDSSCDDGGLVFMAPFGASVSRDSPFILDSSGELVWAATELHGTATNLNVQTYRGEPYLTYWSGDKHGGEGSGAAYMLDSHYNVFKEIKAVGPELRTDLHEFAISDGGTALVSTINDTTIDMQKRGWTHSKDGWIEDSVLQEIDIETGDLLFQWRASDHYKPEDSYFWNPLGGYTKSKPYDFFHLNSIQKDSSGNYLVSSRHLHQLLYLDGSTGDVLWTLGGDETTNDFTDLSEGAATDFKWQHHARLHSNKGIVTLFDNGIAGHFHRDSPYSKALMLQIDRDNRTVELLHAYTSVEKVRSPAQGSVQQLPNGNVFIGWGSAAAWSEHKLSGEVLCEFHFAASWFFWAQRVKNYRTFKVHGWKGEPTSPPIAKTKDGQLYVSWNGATEVRSWTLQGIRRISLKGNAENEEAYEDLETIERQSFESAFMLPSDSAKYTSFRVAALDEAKNVLAYSEKAEPVTKDASASSAALWCTCVGIAGIVTVSLLLVLRARRRRHGQSNRASWGLGGENQYKYTKLPE